VLPLLFTSILKLGKIQEIDGYLKEIISKWDGIVIIVSDHGMHTRPKDSNQEAIANNTVLANKDTMGNHGTLRYQDKLVPYILTRGGRNK